MIILPLFFSLPSLLKLSNTLFREWDTVSIGFIEWLILLLKLIGYLGIQRVSDPTCHFFPFGNAFSRGKKHMLYLGKGFSDQVMLLNSRELCKQLIPTNTTFTSSQCF